MGETVTAPSTRDREREALARYVQALRNGDDQWPTVADWSRNGWLRVADYILAERERREGPLVEALTTIRDYGRATPSQAICAVQYEAEQALAAYRALDAPPVRSLAEVAREIAGRWSAPQQPDVNFYAPLLDELAEAVKRAEGGE